MWRRANWGLVAIVFLLSLLAGGAGAAGPADERPAKVDAHLWATAKKHGRNQIPVIIQMATDEAPDRLMGKHGGKALEPYGFVGAFRAELPPGRLAQLAREQSIRYISLDAPLLLQDIDTTQLRTIYNSVARATEAWNMHGLTGKGIGVAVLDTGVNPHEDLKDHLTIIRTNARALHGGDANGHGTHVAGIIAGRSATGQYIGVAPEAQIIGVKIADDQGISSEGDLLRGLQWVYDNRAKYNIRVVNLSVSGSVPTDYKNSAINAGVEQLWRAGVVVVVASSNRGPVAEAVSYPPSNDPFAITVGALDDNGTLDRTDDSLAYFSSLGITQDGFAKPEIVAPGRKIVAPLAGTRSTLGLRFPERITDGSYLRLSGTSMAAPVVAGAAALLLQMNPNLTPDQVKWALMNGAKPYQNQPAGSAPALDIAGSLNLVAAGNPGAANAGIAWNKGMDLVSGTIKWVTAYWETAYWESVYVESADSMFTDFD